jgi:hypothetical protein
MTTVLVHYGNGQSKVVEVFNLTDLNEMFENITKIDILK